MPLTDWIGLLPLVILGVGTVVIMLVIAIHRSHGVTWMLTLGVLVLGLAGSLTASAYKSTHQFHLLATDGFASFFMALLFGAGLVTCALSYGYLEGRGAIKEEFYVLLLAALLGSAVLVSSRHFASFFLGLEVLSVSLYALIAYLRSTPIHVEAGIKYLIPAATSTGFLLFGMALVYRVSGTMELPQIALWAKTDAHSAVPLFSMALAMILVGVGFKLAVAPFHWWIPDVYEGAPAPVTGFVATASKGAVFALVLRYFGAMDVRHCEPLFLAFGAIAVVSMFFGNLLALLQDNIKRMLAYSSIAHMGYLLVAFLASGREAIAAVSFYLTAYFITTLAAFGVVSILSGKQTDLDKIEDYHGLGFRHPWLAGILTVALFSLAGVPLTAGFIGKFYILSAGVSSSLWALVIILIGNSVIGLFYYLRVIIVLYSRPLVPEHVAASISVPALIPALQRLVSGVTLAILTGALLGLGVYPAAFIRLIEAVATRLS